jgi:Tol biopolymer transport system component
MVALLGNLGTTKKMGIPHFQCTAWALLLLFCSTPSPGFQSQGTRLTAKNARIKSITVIQPSGARPRFSPDGRILVFDQKGSEGFYNVFLSGLQGSVTGSVTAGKSGINQRDNGNARFDQTGNHIVFISEEQNHFGTLIKSLGDPGVGLYSNLWATDTKGMQFWKLTNIPVKQRLLDQIPSMATVNPVFSPDGRTLVWTERYAEGGHDKWGMWRIKAASYVASTGGVGLENEHILITPSKGNYISAMGFFDPDHLLVAGNLDGQHEYGMDQYVYNLRTGQYVNLTNTPENWDEDSCIAPNGQIIWMSNAESRYKFDFSKPWASQPVERDYYLMDRDGQHKERLTFFNDPQAPEYMGGRTLVAACDISPDGRYLAGTLGIDPGKGDRRGNVQLKVILIEFVQPMAGPAAR